MVVTWPFLHFERLFLQQRKNGSEESKARYSLVSWADIVIFQQQMTIVQSRWEETIFHESLMFLHVLGVRHWLLSVLDQLFKDFCMSNSLGSDNVSLQNKGKVCLQPEEEQIVSPHSSQSKEKVCLLPIIKDVGSPSSVFLSCHVSLCVQESFGTHYIILGELGFRERAQYFSYSGYCYSYEQYIVLCLWSMRLMSSNSINETMVGLIVHLQLGKNVRSLTVFDTGIYSLQQKWREGNGCERNLIGFGNKRRKVLNLK